MTDLKSLRVCSLFFVFALLTFNLFYLISETSLISFDESRHAVSAYEMIKNDNYWINYYGEAVDYWNLKPPLSFWSIVCGYKLFGYTAFGLRFFSALSYLLMVIMLVHLSWKKLSAQTAIIAALIISMLPRFMIRHNAKSADPDSLFVCLGFASIYSLLMYNGVAGWYASCLFLSLCFLIKSFHVAAFAIIVLALGLWKRREQILNIKVIVNSFVIGLGPILLWMAYRYSFDGLVFFEKMFFYDALSRAMGGGDHRSFGLFYYLSHMEREFRLPYFFLLSMVIIVGLISFFKKERITFNLENKSFLIQLSLCAIIPIILFSISKGKYRWYTYPSYPFIVILIASLVTSTIKPLEKILCRQRRLFLLGLFLLVFVAVGEVRMLSFMEGNHRKYLNTTEFVIKNLDFPRKGAKIFLGSGDWEQRDLLAAKIFGDMKPCVGGKEAWLESYTGQSILLEEGADSTTFIVSTTLDGVLHEVREISIKEQKEKYLKFFYRFW